MIRLKDQKIRIVTEGDHQTLLFTCKHKVRKKKRIYRYGCDLCAHAVYVYGGYAGKPVKIMPHCSRDQSGGGAGHMVYCPLQKCPYEDELKQFRDYEAYDRHQRELLAGTIFDTR